MTDELNQRAERLLEMIAGLPSVMTDSKIVAQEWQKFCDHAEPLIPDLMAETKRLEDALISQSHFIEQALWKALGYPWFKDDQKNWPHATEADGVCVGDHTPESLAIEAADRIEQQKEAKA